MSEKFDEKLENKNKESSNKNHQEKKEKNTRKKTHYQTRNSRKLYLPVYFMILILLAVILIIKYYDKIPNKTTLIIAGIFIVVALISTELHRLSNYYEIDKSHIVQNKGLIRKNMKRIFIPTISDLNLNQPALQRLLNFGTVEVHRFSEGSNMDVRYINKPRKFMEILEKKMDNIGSIEPFTA